MINLKRAKSLRFVLFNKTAGRRVPRPAYGRQVAAQFFSFFSVFLMAMTAALIFTNFAAYALELPDGVRDYYKDRVSSSPGRSEGVGPTQKPKTKQGTDIGRRETKEYDFSDESAPALTIKAWQALNNKDEDGLLAYTSRCIELYEDRAKDQEALLDDFAPSGSEGNYEYLNNVAACYFIRGEFYKHLKDWKKAKASYQKTVDSFYFAQYWDPRGWWWKPAEISKGEIEKIDSGYYEKKE